jgi:hypothetical protein
MLRSCSPQKSGCRRGVGYRVLGTLDSPQGGYITITAAYTSRFGVPPVGKWVFVSVNANVNGYESIPRVFSARVPAARGSQVRNQVGSGPGGRLSREPLPSAATNPMKLIPPPDEAVVFDNGAGTITYPPAMDCWLGAPESDHPSRPLLHPGLSQRRQRLALQNPLGHGEDDALFFVEMLARVGHRCDQ